MAAYSGSEDVVRVLLNSSGVDVEDISTPSVRFSYLCNHFLFAWPMNIKLIWIPYAKILHVIKSFQGYIALHLASLRGHVGVVGILLSRSTSILEISDSHGLTSLHVAAKNGHFEMVQNLLGQGSDLDNRDQVMNTI